MCDFRLGGGGGQWQGVGGPDTKKKKETKETDEYGGPFLQRHKVSVWRRPEAKRSEELLIGQGEFIRTPLGVGGCPNIGGGVI